MNLSRNMRGSKSYLYINYTLLDSWQSGNYTSLNSPLENGLIKSLNARLLHELLNGRIFYSLR
jgi:hypothetical protein